MIVREKVPTYETIQWTGSNLAECTEFVEERLPAHVTNLNITVESNTFLATGTMFGITAPQDHHIIYGPLYGADRQVAHFAVVEPVPMTTRYEEVV